MTPSQFTRLTALLGLCLGSGLSMLAAQPAQAQGVAYESSEKDNALTILDLKTLTVTGTVATCKRPRHLQRTPDGKQLLVACTDADQADIIDLATRKSVGKLALGDSPEAFDISPDGDDAERAQVFIRGVQRLAVGRYIKRFG